ncbi:autotransporter domain-containing protein [Pararobbsia silviterrae]|uniref:Autotransporter domain-containing protein n=1 Tax=Pararobbsia silviterrae TaxID=1792498 RepID=A0A494XI14_9BURK|nr:autotransporter domain-containing protein [Pararobbsia silviterrae]
MLIGDSTAAVLTVSNGAQVTMSENSMIEGGNTASGIISAMTLTGGSSAIANGNFLVGYMGDGTLNVTGGSSFTQTFSDEAISLGGYDVTDHGLITVSGAGSTLNDAGPMEIAFEGPGTIQISSGGTMTVSGEFDDGYWPGSPGIVTVDGAGSTLNLNGEAAIGEESTGSLTVSNGAHVNATADFVVGQAYGAHGAVVVTDSGSELSLTGTAEIGGTGNSYGSLLITDSGDVTASDITIAQGSSTGILAIGALAGDLAAAPGTLEANSIVFGAGTGSIVFNHTSDNYIFSPLISGSGSVSALSGTTTLSANNVYTGTTSIASGATLQLGAGGTTGSIVTNVTNEGVLAFDRSDDVTFGNLISGAGSVVQNGSGTLTLTAANTYSGGTTVQNGTLAVAANGVLGSGVLTLNAGSTLAFTADGVTLSNDVNIAGSVFANVGANSTDFISGNVSAADSSATLTKTGDGTLVLSGNVSGALRTAIDDGTLLIGSSDVSTGLSGTGGTVDLQSQTLDIAQDYDSTYAGAIIGAGSIRKTGTGNLTLSGANTFAGGIDLEQGTLTVGSNQALGIGTLAMAQATTLDFSATGWSVPNEVTLSGDPTINVATGYTDSVAGNIADGSSSGDLVKTGNGTLVLSGTDTYTGSTTVSAGTLQINGSLVSAVTVENGGTLSGSGVVGGTNVNVDGTLAALAPGSGLHINGSLSLNSGSSYSVAVQPDGTSGMTTVGGNVNIAAGATLSLVATSAPYSVGTVFKVLSYGGTETGTFSTVADDFAYLSPMLSYSDGAIVVTLAPLTTFESGGFAIAAKSGNQVAVANALTTVYRDGGSLTTLALLSAAQEQAPQSLAQLAGDEALVFLQDSERTMNNTQRDVNNRLRDLQQDASGLWVSAGFENNRSSGNSDSGAAASIDRTSSLTLGYDRLVAADWRIGTAVSFNDDSIEFDDRAANGRSDGIQAMLYASYAPIGSNYFVNAITNVGWWENTLSRNVVVGGLEGSPRGTFDSIGESIYVETGLHFATGVAAGVATPYLGVHAGRYQQQSYVESSTSGTDAFDLNYRSGQASGIRSVLGARLSQPITVGSHAVELQADVSWEHRFGPSSDAMEVAFANANTVAYTLEGNRMSSDLARLQIESTWQVTQSATLFVRASGAFGASEHGYGGWGGIRWAW